MRTVAMLANEAADAVSQDVASARDVDLAMRNGLNYPVGPLAWADAIGLAHVRAVLANLSAHYGDPRYRTSPLLRREPAARRMSEAQALAQRVADAMFARDRASQGLGMRIARVGAGPRGARR